MAKHAYLIIAHNKFNILEKLVELLDDSRNDIYIHIDKKVREVNHNRYRELVKKSKLIFIQNPVAVHWGAYSQVESELLLLKEASKYQYDYYHLLSGVDLPLKSQDYIHNFFEQNKGKEFVQFWCEHTGLDKKYINRYRHYHFFQEYAKGKKTRAILKIIRMITETIQDICKIDRFKSQDKVINIGSNWFSITHDFVKYILKNEKYIENTYKTTLCADESFVQTLLYNSSFIDNIYYKKFDGSYRGCMRYIDWERGRPFVWTSKEFDELINSAFLFARKFDDKIDEQVIKDIYEYVKKSSRDNVGG